MSCVTGPSKQMCTGAASPWPSGGSGQPCASHGRFNCLLAHPVLGTALSSLDGPSMSSGLDGYRRMEGKEEK